MTRTWTAAETAAAVERLEQDCEGADCEPAHHGALVTDAGRFGLRAIAVRDLPRRCAVTGRDERGRVFVRGGSITTRGVCMGSGVTWGAVSAWGSDAAKHRLVPSEPEFFHQISSTACRPRHAVTWIFRPQFRCFFDFGGLVRFFELARLAVAGGPGGAPPGPDRPSCSSVRVSTPPSSAGPV